MSGIYCCECKQPIGRRGARTCAGCGGLFHFPDARVGEEGSACGTHIIGMREILGHDVVPFCLRCDMAFRLQYGVPS